MKRWRLLALCALVPFAACATANHPLPSLPSEELAILRVAAALAVKRVGGTGPLVMRRWVGMSASDRKDLETLLSPGHSLSKVPPDLSPEMLDALAAVNSQGLSLSRADRVQLGVPGARLRDEPRPGTARWVQLSRPAVSKDGTVALVYLEARTVHGKERCFYDDLCLLRRKDGEWTLNQWQDCARSFSFTFGVPP